jgi:type I restriction enzyme R subunit
MGWTNDQISDEYPITGGRIRATARYFEREMPLRADYALEFTPGLVIGVVEAKRTRKNAGDGIEQAKRYARLLDVPFAYATNGKEIFEIHRATGLITPTTRVPVPEGAVGPLPGSRRDPGGAGERSAARPLQRQAAQLG